LQGSGHYDIPVFDVHQKQAYTFGGDYDRSGATFWKGTHPRGIRWAFTNFDMAGLQPHPAMALNSHGIYDTHMPDNWSRIKFVI
jgi:hypothetical protein